MKSHLISIAVLTVSLLIVFAVLDFFNLTAWLVFPYSIATGKNKALTSAMGRDAVHEWR